MALPRFACCLLLILLIFCGPTTHRDPVLGEAFVGPASVNLRKEIAPSPSAATLHFGEKVQIVGKRRIFVRIRTSSGAEGWIDENMLLGQSDIDQIRAQSATARNYPSQGTAITDTVMNVHAQPSQSSPSYIQLKPGEKFDVLEHRLVKPPLSASRKSLIPPAPKAIKKPKKETRVKIPPPVAPPLPLDWVDLSKEGEAAIPPRRTTRRPPILKTGV